MNLPDLKKLKAIIALCRKSGVESIEIEGIKIVLKDSSYTPSIRKRASTKKSDLDNTPDPIETDDLTQDQLLHWSVYSPPGISEDPTENNS